MAEKTENPPPYAGQPLPDQQHPAGPSMQPIVVSSVMVSPHIGPKPSSMTCPSCREQITSRVELMATTKTHLVAAVLCLFGCWCCVCIPYCTDCCRDANHYCPHCNAYIGVRTF